MARAAKWVALTVVAVVAASLPADDALAGGYGIYLEAEFSDATIDQNIPFNAQKVVRDFKSSMGGVGFVYDTNVSRDEPFNYRFKIGYRYGHRKWDKSREVTIQRRADQEDPDTAFITFKASARDAQGLTFNQTLGYGFVRTPSLRIWAGPTMRLNVDWYGVATDLDVVDLAVGAGPEVGINFHLNDRLSLSTSISYNFLYLTESFESTGKDRRLTGSQHLLAFSVSLFYRSESDRWGE